MLWLRYSCPFGGKHYPFYVILATVWAIVILALLKQWDGTGYYVAIFLIPALELVGCALYEHHLNTEDQQMVAEAEQPLWEPLSDELAEAAAQYAARPLTSSEITSMLLILVSSPMILWSGMKPLRPIGLLTALVCIVFLVLSVLSRMHWREIDGTAAAARVPISHMYDVEDRLLHLYHSYLVFYLPDGKYTVKARPGSGLARAVYLITYRGRVMWLPEPPPKEL